METLPMRAFLLLREAFQRFWVRAVVYVGCGSFCLFALMGLTCLFTYMRVSDDYRVKMMHLGMELLTDVDVEKEAVAKLKGEIVGYQTVIQAFARRGRRVSLGIFEVTAYDPKGCEPFNDGVTSIGLPVGDGIFAVNPLTIPYGSILHIPEIAKYGIAGDTGAAMRADPNALDIFVPVRKDALEFGRQRLEVELLAFEESGYVSGVD